MVNNIIEKIKIAELDPNKVYFLQICAGELNIEQFKKVNEILKEEFRQHNIKNITFYGPSSVELKFTEVADVEDNIQSSS